ncbi:MAG TPA: VOC family protein [Thermomicrobiaceae bacterium]|nr:VOC family protein [Thermomicrobiaceae bacterium]
MATLQPMLHVRDIDGSLDFYQDVLGFIVGLTVTDASGTTVHAEVERNGVRFMLGSASEVSEAARSLLGAGLVLYITDNDEDIDELFEHARDHGARVVEEPINRYWGDRTFTVRDLDGYLLTFARNVHAHDPAGVPA